MALGDAYATVSEFKGYAEHFSDTVDDTQITEVLLQASRAVDQLCDRQFNKDSGGASARVYHPDNYCRVTVDDFWTTSGLIIKTDSSDAGTYPTTLDSTQYTLEPLNGIVSGESGWPYSKILTISTWLPHTVRPSVQVTAQWGWNAVPTNVKVATIYLALETFKLKGAPFGVANFDQFGPVRVRDNPRVMAMLAPYRQNPVLLA